MEKIKSFIESEKGKDILTVLIVILVGLGSFELGRLSKENTSNSLKIEYNGKESDLTASALNSAGSAIFAPKSTQNSQNQASASGDYFASKRGKKYYPVNCSAGKSIKVENRIYFETSADAEKAGYTLSGSCS